MHKFWIILHVKSQEPIYDDKGMLLTFSSPEEAEAYIKEHNISGMVVEFPKPQEE